jgi:hypothetical protein
MSEQQPTGLLFAGDLLISVRNPTTGEFGGYIRRHADKFEIKTPSDMLQKKSKGRETFGQAWLTHFMGKPAEFSAVLDDIDDDSLAMQLAGVVSPLTQTAGALAGITITVDPGKWTEIGYENLDLATLSVTNDDATTTYTKDVDYQVNPRTGMIFVPVGGAIPAGTVKFTAGKKAFTSTQIAGGKEFSTTLRMKLDGVNLITRRNMLVVVPQATVSASDAYDFLSGKLASVPLKGLLEIAPGENAPFTLKDLGA